MAFSCSLFSKTSIRHWRWDLTWHGFNGFSNPIHFTTAQTTPSITNLWVMGLALIIGVAMFSLGTSFEMLSDLGKSPYDSVAPIVADNRHIRYRYVRLTQDIIIAILAFFLHGPIGIGTLVCATCNGIFISTWRRLLKKHICIKNTLPHIQNKAYKNRFATCCKPVF
ncbi:Uncharacterised protein [Weissella viridescens]|uniref:Uncharacterized protein n=1 Tax=Weissella viridescens TaxID=1629 RepID=A0A380NYD3_WEIVI|nr:Uncharacterised protein [Weissella viridescens]